MILKHVEVMQYKSFLTKQEFDVENGITVLVGKNESGKTAILETLAKYNYFEKDDKFAFSDTSDYPRAGLIDYRKSREKENAPAAKVIRCLFELDDELISLIEDELGKGVVANKSFLHQVDYDNMGYYSNYKFSFTAFVNDFMAKHIDDEQLKGYLLAARTIEEMLIACNKVVGTEGAQAILEGMVKGSWPKWGDTFSSYIIAKFIHENRPKFWFFDEYYSLPGRISIQALLNPTNRPNQYTKEEYGIATALLELAGISAKEISESADFEKFKANLEATSNKITDDMFEYWTTNRDLEIEIADERSGGEQFINIRIKNKTYRVSLPLRSRSKGFLWFFSFLVWFSKINASSKGRFILLLDEPGVSLHASAQADLLRFIREKLSTQYQTIYTTHSPFMIEPSKLHEVRTVYDSQNAKIGSLISDAVQEKDPDTLFPLQAALGYDIAQNLYISSKNLLVEGVSDTMYLTAISDILKSKKRIGIDDDISLVPVGGLDKVASFISLLRGSELDVVCLLDRFTDQAGKQRLDDLVCGKIIKAQNVRYFGEFCDNGQDIEDLFSKKEYLLLFNAAFGSELGKITISKIKAPKNPLLPQINQILGKSRFNHYRPANEFLKLPDKEAFLSDETLSRFEELFKAINKLFS